MSKITKSAVTLITNVLTVASQLGVSIERDLSTDSTLPETPSGDYAKVFVDGGTAAMIIPLQHKGGVKWCDLHIDWAGKAGYIPLDASNGRVICRVDPSKVDLALLLTHLSGAQIRDRKGATKAASKATSEMLAALKALGLPDASPAVIVRKPNGVPAEQPTDSEEAEGEFTES